MSSKIDSSDSQKEKTCKQKSKITQRKDYSKEEKSFSSKKNSIIKGRKKSIWSDQEQQQLVRIQSIVQSLYENDESSPRKADFSDEENDDLFDSEFHPNQSLLKTIHRNIIRESQKIDEKSGEDTNQSKEYVPKNYQKRQGNKNGQQKKFIDSFFSGKLKNTLENADLIQELRMSKKLDDKISIIDPIKQMQNVNEKFKEFNQSLRNSNQKIEQSITNKRYNQLQNQIKTSMEKNGKNPLQYISD